MRGPLAVLWQVKQRNYLMKGKVLTWEKKVNVTSAKEDIRGFVTEFPSNAMKLHYIIHKYVYMSVHFFP